MAHLDQINVVLHVESNANQVLDLVAQYEEACRDRANTQKRLRFVESHNEHLRAVRTLDKKEIGRLREHCSALQRENAVQKHALARCSDFSMPVMPTAMDLDALAAWLGNE